MFAACKIPAGFIVRHDDREIVLNGPNTGLNPELLPTNGNAPDSPTRSSGWGVTEVQGQDAEALKSWVDMTGKGDGPVKADAIFVVQSRRELDAEVAKRNVSGFAGLDPAKDLPKDLETANDKPAKG